jgi:hypothetical protein
MQDRINRCHKDLETSTSFSHSVKILMSDHRDIYWICYGQTRTGIVSLTFVFPCQTIISPMFHTHPHHSWSVWQAWLASMFIIISVLSWGVTSDPTYRKLLLWITRQLKLFMRSIQYYKAQNIITQRTRAC